MKKLSFAGLKGRVSWGSVFGGVMTVLAISVLLSILNSSIGLFMFDPLSDHPVAGIGTAVGIGSAIILVAGMAAGGFVAGKLAGMDGMIHGFLVWATTLIVAVVLGIFLAVGAAKMTVNTLGAVSSVTGSVLSGTGDTVGNGVAALSEDASVSAVAYKFLAPIQIRENKTITPQPISIFFFISGPHHHIQILFP